MVSAWAEGGSLTWEQDFSLLAPMIKAAGITRIANVTGLDELGIPVVVVVRPSSRSLSVSQGKGLTLAAAKIAGVMESLEQFHAERIRLPLTLATAAELARARRVVNVELLPRTSRRFGPHTRTLWISAKELSTEASAEVPFELVHLDFTLPLPEGSGYFQLSSNGLASGRTASSATAHAIWELIERDAMALFYERSPAEQSRRRIALSSIDDPCCRSLLQRLEGAGLALAIWDMTSDVGVAAFLCSLAEHEYDPSRSIGLARGYGCHPDRGQALLRAMLEAAQTRLTRIAGSRDDFRAADVDSLRSAESIERHRAHVAQEKCATHPLAHVPSMPEPAELDPLAWTLARLAAAGLGEVFRVDLSDANSPISVVRCIIPGLEGIPDTLDHRPGARVSALRAQA